MNDKDEIATEVQQEPKKKVKKRKRRKKGHKGAFLLGLVIVAFAVFGVYKAAVWGYGRVSDIADGSSKISEYGKFLEPFVVIDPSPFDDVRSAEPIDLLDAAISSLIYNSGKLNKYDIFEGEVTGLLVPQEDVEEYFVKVFGNEVKLVHTDVDDSFYGVMYNAEKSAYIIPITSVDPTYTPKIYSVDKKGSSIILTVGYIGGTEWAQLEQGQYTAPEPSKFMKITLREEGRTYHIGSLQATEAVEIAEEEKTVPTTSAETEEQRVIPTAAETTEPLTDEDGNVVQQSTDENESSAESETDTDNS